MEGAPKYQPSPEEMKSAEEQMGSRQEAASKLREEIVERLGSSDAEFINDLKNLQKTKRGDNGYVIEGVVKGHKVYIVCKDGYNDYTVIADGKELNHKDAYDIGTKYNKFIETGVSGYRHSLSALEVKEDMAKGELFQEENYDSVIKDLKGK